MFRSKSPAYCFACTLARAAHGWMAYLRISSELTVVTKTKEHADVITTLVATVTERVHFIASRQPQMSDHSLLGEGP